MTKGRPLLPGRRILVKLEEPHIAIARALGNGNISEGIRAALKRIRIIKPN